jgi:hypothetical protein
VQERPATPAAALKPRASSPAADSFAAAEWEGSGFGFGAGGFGSERKTRTLRSQVTSFSRRRPCVAALTPECVQVKRRPLRRTEEGGGDAGNGDDDTISSSSSALLDDSSLLLAEGPGVAERPVRSSCMSKSCVLIVVGAWQLASRLKPLVAAGLVTALRHWSLLLQRAEQPAAWQPEAYT